MIKFRFRGRERRRGRAGRTGFDGKVMTVTHFDLGSHVIGPVSLERESPVKRDRATWASIGVLIALALLAWILITVLRPHGSAAAVCTRPIVVTEWKIEVPGCDSAMVRSRVVYSDWCFADTVSMEVDTTSYCK